MKKTLHIDAKLLAEARAVSGATTDTEAVRLGLEALLRRAAYERLRALRGSESGDAGRAAAPREIRAQAPGGVMVLVDTSVWVRFLTGREPYASALDRLLATDGVAGHDLVHGELLMGDTGTRRTMLESYALIDRVATVPHAEVVEFVKARRLRGRGIGWVDAHLLAATLVARCTLWTADAGLADLAGELGARHAPIS